MPAFDMMPAFSPEQLAVGQIAVAAVLGTFGLFFLLPRPRGRAVGVGVALTCATAVVAAVFVATTFAVPTTEYVAPALFWLFAGGALAGGAGLVTQSNPARGAMAFAFVILSTCGLFLLLAAPFLMAATVIIYMGAIVVTFLFVLMLSHAKGPSDENDRSREPFLGSLAGFAFAGLILFTLYLGGPAAHPATAAGPHYPLPAVGVTPEDKVLLLAAAEDLKQAAAAADPAEVERLAKSARTRLAEVVGYASGEAIGEVPAAGSTAPRAAVQDRLRVAAADGRVSGLVDQADRLRDEKKRVFDGLENALVEARTPDLGPSRAAFEALRGQTLLLVGRGELPARNVSAIGLTLYSDHLLAVELAGTLLLVATVGAVAVAGRKGGVPA